MDRLWIKGSSLETVHSLKKKKSAVPTLRHLNLPADICFSKRYYERRSLSLQAMYVSLIIDTARYIQVMKSMGYGSNGTVEECTRLRDECSFVVNKTICLYTVLRARFCYRQFRRIDPLPVRERRGSSQRAEQESH